MAEYDYMVVYGCIGLNMDVYGCIWMVVAAAASEPESERARLWLPPEEGRLSSHNATQSHLCHALKDGAEFCIEIQWIEVPVSTVLLVRVKVRHKSYIFELVSFVFDFFF